MSHRAALISLFTLAVVPCLAAAQEAPTAEESAGTSRFSWSGSHRTRYSALHNQFRSNLSGDDRALTLQTLLRAELARGVVSLVGELEDVRTYLADDNTAVSTGEVNAVELLQGYVGLRLGGIAGSESRLDLKLGRVTMDLGSRRLVARNRYRDVIQNYTGVTVEWAGTGGSVLTAFAVLPVLVEPSDRESVMSNDIERDDADLDFQFWGGFYERPGMLLDGTAEFYLFVLNERDDLDERQTFDRELYTPGVRFIRAPQEGLWDFDVEHTFQFGTRRASRDPADVRDLDVFAHFHHVEVGYTFRGVRALRVDMEYDYATGDADLGDGEWQRFDTLFGPRRTEFGPLGIYGLLGRENIESLGVRLSSKLGPRIDAYAAYRVNRLDESTDSLALSGVRDASGHSGRDVGRQLELRARYWAVPDSIRLELGAVYFSAGRFLRDAPNATREGNPTFWYADVAYTFGDGR